MWKLEADPMNKNKYKRIKKKQEDKQLEDINDVSVGKHIKKIMTIKALQENQGKS